MKCFTALQLAERGLLPEFSLVPSNPACCAPLVFGIIGETPMLRHPVPTAVILVNAWPGT
jgi:hypothetical protein